jgi:tyrosine-protein kinase Etk/Wzc
MAKESQYRTDVSSLPEGLSIPPEEMESSIDFPALLKLLREGKRTIAIVTLAALVLAITAAFLLPVRFTAVASFVPPNSGMSGAGALAGQLSQLSGLGGGLLGSVKSPGDLYVGILKSHLIANALIKRFDLEHVYGVRKTSQAAKMLANNSDFAVGVKDSIVTISVTDRSAERARDIANAYLEELKNTTGGLALTESSERRLFFEQRLAQEKNALADSEVALKQSQEKSGLIAPSGQTAVEIQAIAQLRSQIALRQVSLASLLHDETEENPDVLRLRSELNSLQAQVSQMANGKSGGPSGALSTAQVPGLELEYVRLARDVKYHEALFQIIAKQFEAARIDEARDAPLQILDRATVPDSKSGPARMYIVLGGLLFGLAAGTVGVILKPVWIRMSEASVAS